MLQKIKSIYSIVLLLLLLSLTSVNFTQAADTNTAVQSQSTLDLYSLIQQAKTELLPVKLNYGLTPHYKPIKAAARKKGQAATLSHYTLDVKDLALAIFDPSDNQIKIVMAMQKGKDFEFPSQYAGNFEIKKIYFNGVNTRFLVNKPAGGKVLALKYLITPIESGNRASIESQIYDGVYVPYSPELLDKEFIKKGAQYLDGVIASVQEQLKTYPSTSSPGKTVPEVITAELVRALIYAEHMDTTEFLNNPDTGHLADKINVLLAGNQGDTWKYSVSSAGASGISQFIPSTYASLIKRHASLNLNPDFVLGMRDHQNAIKATFLLLDDYIEAVRNRAPDHFLPGHAFDYGAAAYNGGPVRVAKAAQNFGPVWYNDHADKLLLLQTQISGANSIVKTLKSQIAKTKVKAEKTKLQKTLTEKQSELEALTKQKDALASGILRNETVNYILKIHRLIQHFNSQSKNLDQVASK